MLMSLSYKHILGSGNEVVAQRFNCRGTCVREPCLPVCLRAFLQVSVVLAGTPLFFFFLFSQAGTLGSLRQLRLRDCELHHCACLRVMKECYG